MGANKNIIAYHLAVAVTLPAASGTYTSNPTNIWTLDNISYQFTTPSTDSLPKGTFDIQVSNSHDQQGAWQQGSVYAPPGSAGVTAGGVQTQAGTFTSILGLITPAPVFSGASNALSVYVNLAGLAARFVRFVYTSDPTSPGTGTFDAWIVGKST
jgi:hypothetical protein